MLAERVRSLIVDNDFDLGEGIRLKKSCSIGLPASRSFPQSPRVLGWHDWRRCKSPILPCMPPACRTQWLGWIVGDAGLQIGKILDHIQHDIIGLLDKELLVTSNLDIKAVTHAWVHAVSALCIAKRNFQAGKWLGRPPRNLGREKVWNSTATSG